MEDSSEIEMREKILTTSKATTTKKGIEPGWKGAKSPVLHEGTKGEGLYVKSK